MNFNWIDIEKQQPEAVQGNKVLGHNGNYAFECEFDDDCWCNIGGETMKYWMPLPPNPRKKD